MQLRRTIVPSHFIQALVRGIGGITPGITTKPRNAVATM